MQSVAGRVWTEHSRCLLLLWALVLLAYSNSFRAGLLFDSGAIVLEDPRIRVVTPGNIGAILTHSYWYINPGTGLYRPVVTLSYLVNNAVLGGGANPTGYHLFNFLLQGINASLVYALGLLIFAESLPGLALAALWALHPLLTESVTNIVGRADELAAFSVLAGFLCYARWISTEGRHKRWWLAAMLVIQTIGLFSKENAAVLPGILLLYDLLFSRRSAWRARIPAYAALLVPFATFLLVRTKLHIHMVVDSGENPLISASFWTARLTAIKVIGKYLWLFVWPARLAPDYSYKAFPLFGWNLANWEDQKTLLALAVSVGLVVLAIVCRRSWKPLSFFIGFFFVALIPTANLIVLIGSIMGERFMYLPAIGLAGCLVAVVQRASAHWRASANALKVAAALVCLGLVTRTYARNSDWHDDLSLWSRAVEVCPGSARPHMNLGLALSERPGRLAEAIAQYRTALGILPNNSQERYNLALALDRTPGGVQEAISQLQQARQLDPHNAAIHYNLGLMLEQTERWPDALEELRAAVRDQPDLAVAHNNLGNLLARMPDHQSEAMAEWRAAVDSDPDLADAHYNLGNGLSDAGRMNEAIAEYRAALRSRPDFAQAHNNLANALARTPGGMNEAIREWQLALRIQPDLIQAHVNLGTALSGIPGQLPNAIAELETAQRLQADPQVQQLLDRLRTRQQ